MAKFYGVPGTGEPSDVSFDDMRYELTNDDWQSQEARQQGRRWQMVRDAASKVGRAVKGSQR